MKNLSHNRLPFGTRGSLALDTTIAPYTIIPLVFLLCILFYRYTHGKDTSRSHTHTPTSVLFLYQPHLYRRIHKFYFIFTGIAPAPTFYGHEYGV